MVIKDDTPGLELNSEMHPNSQNPKTLPTSYEYEIPMSLNAEICLSEFRPSDKAPSATSNKTAKVTLVVNKVEGLIDNSDFLYDAFADAQKPSTVVKKINIRRMKSVSPQRGGII